MSRTSIVAKSLQVDMAAKHFINDGKTLVQDALHGLALSNPSIRYDEDIKGKQNTFSPEFVIKVLC